jgi:hypothetical protein
MRVLVAVDGSPWSEAAVSEVASRPWPSNSKFSEHTAQPVLGVGQAPAAKVLERETCVIQTSLKR